MLLSFLLTCATLGQTPQPPLNPYTLGREEVGKGNPLAQYAEMLKREREFMKDLLWVDAYTGQPSMNPGVSSYTQARATVEGNLGAIERSLRTQVIGWYAPPATRPYAKSSLEGKRAMDVVDYIQRQSANHSWVLLGEEHMKPQTRSFLVPLLRRMWNRGFRYFAAETFSAAAKIEKQGYVGWHDGYYTQDPVFAEAVREAVRLGYKLVEYEHTTPPPKDAPANDPFYAQNLREHGQAANLKARIFDRDPKAKVIVWAGRSHAMIASSKQDGSEFRPMGYELRQMIGATPLSLYLGTNIEAGDPRYERPEYKYATSRGLVRKPCVFVGRDGSAADREGTAFVFFPRTTYVHGRPDWLTRDLGRVARPIPASMANGTGYLLAQVWLEGEPVTAVPVDQILLAPGDPLPDVMVPKGRRCWMRVIDAEGKELGRQNLVG